MVKIIMMMMSTTTAIAEKGTCIGDNDNDEHDDNLTYREPSTIMAMVIMKMMMTVAKVLVALLLSFRRTRRHWRCSLVACTAWCRQGYCCWRWEASRMRCMLCTLPLIFALATLQQCWALPARCMPLQASAWRKAAQVGDEATI